MYFDQKLRGLMQLFKLSNSKLARGINVDASLVSRWKSGERAMAANSPHIPAIASFFLKLNAYHYQKEYLDFILKNHLNDKTLDDESRKIHALSDWLISEEPADLSAGAEKAHSPAATRNIIANIAGLMSGQMSGQMSAKTSDLPRLAETYAGSAVIPGEACSYERYTGLQGRRQAVLNFLLSVIHSDRKLDILLTSEDDMVWLTGDRQFTMIWASLLKQIIESGHRVTIIHVVNRQREEIMQALNYWMPLHLAGTIKSYYYPKYSDQPVKKTLFIARGKSAIVSWTTSENSEVLTFLYEDAATVEVYESMYDSHLNQCRQLFSVFTRSNNNLLLESGLEIRKKRGATFNIRNQLNSLVLPAEYLNTILEDGSQHLRNARIVELIKQHQELFARKLLLDDYYDIIPVTLLEELEISGKAEVDSCLLCLDKPWYVSREQTIHWLEETVRTLRRFDHYHVLISSSIPGLEDINVNIVYQEDSGALFSPGVNKQRQPMSIMLSEANILRSLSFYFDDYIQSIPTVQKQKEDVIAILEKLIFRLRDYHNQKM